MRCLADYLRLEGLAASANPLGALTTRSEKKRGREVWLAPPLDPRRDAAQNGESVSGGPIAGNLYPVRVCDGEAADTTAPGLLTPGPCSFDLREFGSPDGTRTPDPVVNSRLFHQLSGSGTVADPNSLNRNDLRVCRVQNIRLI